MLDEIDTFIIRELMENARKPFREIAMKLKLSDVAVIKRVRKLEERGVIRKYALIVNPAVLGYNKISFTGINVKPDKLFEVASKLREKEYVKYIALTSGDHELLAVIWARDSEELKKIHDEIKNIEGVINIYPAILTDIIKADAYV
ncbi:Lrp/AsnC family transcriptional regulator [Desulfurococcus amylolyticus]|uniref:Putative transcriptional regulator, AsnC family n=1 Tax=Desulfurococcus amylolyticus (strain DSM 18924 / JCM 16383 / VKM B-2413 / 1221n) TaxID=490899 RepID=B8D3S6_DESA1|nr:Lrp/AsnC family transcriptional regulator [Desulfurococcus amylolyticus]ACL10757.1 putative transcriptional regulator, AsnC family [Desulfurococcus amylolyticus 1221n]